jgi:4-hydroxy-tetrahydrodipicolinate synthase
MTKAITGLWAAVTTPIGADGAIDTAAFIHHANRLISQGCDGLVLFGSCGEGPSFSIAQRLTAAEAVMHSGIPAAKLAMGTGCAAIADSITLTKGALGLGIVNAMILPPFYFAGVSAQGIEDAFARIIDGIADNRLSACLYHIPQVCGVGVPAEVLGSMSRRYPGVVTGVKDSSGDWDTFAAFRAAAPDVASLVGAEVLINRAIGIGGAGTICGMANLVPALCRRQLTDASAVADMQAACGYIDSIPAIKATLAALNGEAIWNRMVPPLVPGDTAAATRAAAALRQLEAGQKLAAE